MHVVIRKVLAGDRAQVARLSDRLTEGVAAWRDPAAVLDAVRGWIADSTSDGFDGTALVAIDEHDRVVGFVSVSTTGHFAGERDAYIGELIVAPDAEGRGVGAQLVAAAEEQALADGHRCITLTTGAANDRALAFYRRLGYLDEDVKLTKVLTDG